MSLIIHAPPKATTATIANLGGLTQSGRLITSTIPNNVIQPRLTFAKTSAPSGSPVGAGHTITYSLTLTNNGFVPAHDLVITDALPAERSTTSPRCHRRTPPSGRLTGTTWAAWRRTPR